jgi:hypothetical protein
MTSATIGLAGDADNRADISVGAQGPDRPRAGLGLFQPAVMTGVSGAMAGAAAGYVGGIAQRRAILLDRLGTGSDRIAVLPGLVLARVRQKVATFTSPAMSDAPRPSLSIYCRSEGWDGWRCHE